MIDARAERAQQVRSAVASPGKDAGEASKGKGKQREALDAQAAARKREVEDIGGGRSGRVGGGGTAAEDATTSAAVIPVQHADAAQSEHPRKKTCGRRGTSLSNPSGDASSTPGETGAGNHARQLQHESISGASSSARGGTDAPLATFSAIDLPVDQPCTRSKSTGTAAAAPGRLQWRYDRHTQQPAWRRRRRQTLDAGGSSSGGGGGSAVATADGRTATRRRGGVGAGSLAPSATATPRPDGDGCSTKKKLTRTATTLPFPAAAARRGNNFANTPAEGGHGLTTTATRTKRKHSDVNSGGGGGGGGGGGSTPGATGTVSHPAKTAPRRRRTSKEAGKTGGHKRGLKDSSRKDALEAAPATAARVSQAAGAGRERAKKPRAAKGARRSSMLGSDGGLSSSRHVKKPDDRGRLALKGRTRSCRLGKAGGGGGGGGGGGSLVSKSRTLVRVLKKGAEAGNVVSAEAATIAAGGAGTPKPPTDEAKPKRRRQPKEESTASGESKPSQKKFTTGGSRGGGGAHGRGRFIKQPASIRVKRRSRPKKEAAAPGALATKGRPPRGVAAGKASRVSKARGAAAANRCRNPSCGLHASFGFPTEGAPRTREYCLGHALPGMVNLVIECKKARLAAVAAAAAAAAAATAAAAAAGGSTATVGKKRERSSRTPRSPATLSPVSPLGDGGKSVVTPSGLTRSPIFRSAASTANGGGGGGGGGGAALSQIRGPVSKGKGNGKGTGGKKCAYSGGRGSGPGSLTAALRQIEGLGNKAKGTDKEEGKGKGKGKGSGKKVAGSSGGGGGGGAGDRSLAGSLLPCELVGDGDGDGKKKENGEGPVWCS